MKMGTKSLLFGVHQFLWHPLTVGLAWQNIYHVWPKWHEWVAIFCHDLGYWGCPNMDGPEGRQHPLRGADLAFWTAFRLRYLYLRIRHPVTSWKFPLETWKQAERCGLAAYRLAIGHSRFFAKEVGIEVSLLFRADKVSIFYEPEWWYILRASLSGEIWEYVENAPVEVFSNSIGFDLRRHWFRWYQDVVWEKFT